MINIIQHLVILIYIHNYLTWDSLLILHLFSFLRSLGDRPWPVKLLKMKLGICKVLPSDFSFACAIFHFLFVLLSIIFSGDRNCTSNVGSNCRKNMENLENVDNILTLEDVESSASRFWAWHHLPFRTCRMIASSWSKRRILVTTTDNLLNQRAQRGRNCRLGEVGMQEVGDGLAS